MLAGRLLDGHRHRREGPIPTASLCGELHLRADDGPPGRVRPRLFGEQPAHRGRNKDGTPRAPFPPIAGIRGTNIFFRQSSRSRTTDDRSYQRLDQSLLAEAGFDIGGRPLSAALNESFASTPRGVFRPGGMSTYRPSSGRKARFPASSR
jgi:hypothetical protein